MIVCSVQDANILSSSLKYLSLYLLTVASFYPSGFPIAPEAARFLYYYSSVYLKSFKELFLQRSGEVFHSRKRMQRYSFFQHKPNISTKKLKIFFTYWFISTKMMALGTIYLIIYYIGRLTAIIHTKCRTLQKDIKPSALISGLRIFPVGNTVC